LWTVPVLGPPEALAAPRDVTEANAGWDGTPRYSPDGRYLAWRTQKTPGYESDCFRLALLDRQSGETRVLTGSFDDWVDDLAWTSDSTRILFTAEVKGRTPLDELEVATGRIRQVSAVGFLDAFVPSPDARWAVVARRQIAHPLELYRISLADGSEIALTAHNATLEAEVDIRPAEEMFVTGADGKKVQVFLIKPHGFDPSRRYPLILNVHGGPQTQWADSFRGDWQVYPGAGYVLAFPNPHGSTGWGQAYTAEISSDWDGKVMQDVEKVTDALAALPYVDPDRMGAMGWSWGGYAMMWLEGHSTRFKALASMMGLYDLRTFFSSTEELWFPKWDLKGTPWENPGLYARLSPSEYVTAFRTPCLVITGELDYRVPYTQSLAFFTDLQERHVPSRLIVFEKAGHWPAWNEMALYYAAHLDWFHRWLGGEPSPWDPAEMVRTGAFAPETQGSAP
jgi:dipeptidyl aminopeptidase/acylaminoacyl peptidase